MMVCLRLDFRGIRGLAEPGARALERGRCQECRSSCTQDKRGIRGGRILTPARMARQRAATLRLPCIILVGEAPVIIGPGDEMAAGTAGRGRLRASHADREQVIGTLKDVFVQGLLDKDEFDRARRSRRGPTRS